MTKEYGYGHTKEAASIVREALKERLKRDIKPYGLKISVRKATSSYGGPRVTVTTDKIELDRRYKWIVDENGKPADSGKLIEQPVSVTKTWDRSMELVVPQATKELNDKINSVLHKFGKDEDDAMTDYFHNTTPLFYGVEYVEAK